MDQAKYATSSSIKGSGTGRGGFIITGLFDPSKKIYLMWFRIIIDALLMVKSLIIENQ